MDCLKMNLSSENKLPRISIVKEQIDQRLTSFNSRYTFSAKEKDIETGYSYFGARYYTSDLSIWLSVDPLSDKYPSMSPYLYCANNPVILVDPDGAEVEGWILGKDGRYIYDSRVNNQEDAVKYYGKEAQSIANGSSYKSKQGEVTLLDKGVFMLNGVKNKVKDQATGLSKIAATVKNAVNRLDEDGHNDGANDGDPLIEKYAGPILKGFALFNPLLGLPNDAKILAKGEDIYDNKAKTMDKVVAGVDIVTFGGAKAAKYIGTGLAKAMNTVNKATTGISVATTIKNEYKKIKD